MADYIYLLQSRLTPAQWRALEAVREAARVHAMPVFLVGGAVRDLTSGAPVRDLDFALQGEVRALVGELEGRGAVVAGENPVLGSVFFTFRGGVRVEVGTTLSVSYPKPGQPETHPAAILEDLRRRDFTANAMAVSLNEGSYGLLLDPLNGTADIENRELRLVSAYGFIEQPALLLRAARLGERLGWSLEERTQGRYETSKEEGHIGALPDWDRGYELEEIFHEEDPLMVLEQMEAEGWREVLFPGLRVADADRGGLDEVRDLMGQLDGQKLHPDPSAVYFPLITAKLGEEKRAALTAQFARQGFVRQVETMEARGKELANQLAARSTPLPSDAWKLLMGADAEVVLWLAYHSRSGAVQSRLKAFLKDWPQMRTKIPYGLMQEMRITPDLPGYEGLLDELFFALIDGKLDTPEATRAFLEPFSPPAPPQVSVRRRPAKSARGRGKRAAAQEAVVPAEEADEADRDEDAEEPEEQPTATVSEGAGSEAEEDQVEPVLALAAAEDVPEVAVAVEAAPAPTAEPRAVAKRAKPVETPKVVAKAAAPVKAAAKKTVAVAKTAVGRGGKKAPPVKVVAAAAKKAVAKTPVKVAGKAAASKKAPVKAVAKVAAQGAAAKKAVAKAPVKVAAKAGGKVAAKKPAPAVAKKAAKAVKAVNAPAKRVPAKAVKGAAKKVAVKGRSGR